MLFSLTVWHYYTTIIPIDVNVWCMRVCAYVRAYKDIRKRERKADVEEIWERSSEHRSIADGRRTSRDLESIITQGLGNDPKRREIAKERERERAGRETQSLYTQSRPINHEHYLTTVRASHFTCTRCLASLFLFPLLSLSIHLARVIDWLAQVSCSRLRVIDSAHCLEIQHQRKTKTKT